MDAAEGGGRCRWQWETVRAAEGRRRAEGGGRLLMTSAGFCFFPRGGQVPYCRPAQRTYRLAYSQKKCFGGPGRRYRPRAGDISLSVVSLVSLSLVFDASTQYGWGLLGVTCPQQERLKQPERLATGLKLMDQRLPHQRMFCFLRRGGGVGLARRLALAPVSSGFWLVFLFPWQPREKT
jgi:hypothetical protein